MPSEAEQIRYIREAISSRPWMSRLLTEETRWRAGLDGAIDSPPAGPSGTFAEHPAAPLSPTNPTVPPAPRAPDAATIAPVPTTPNAASIPPPSTAPDLATLPTIHPTPIAPSASDSQNVATAEGAETQQPQVHRRSGRIAKK